MFVRVDYRDLNARQQENYNFHRIAARLAEYGYHSIRLSDDFEGADFLALHINGSDILRVQLKGRLAFDRKYLGKELHIAFLHGEDCFVFPHDDVLQTVLQRGMLREDSDLWATRGFRSWPTPPRWALEMLADYRI